MDVCRFLFAVIILHVLTSVAPVTPPDDVCFFYVHKSSTLEKTGTCEGENLKEVPRNVDPGLVSRLNLQDTHITILDEASFTTWTDVEVLDADNNRIRKITEKAFKPLKNLRKLTLSNNQLILNGGVSSNVFRYIPQLQILDLSRNPLGTIPNKFFKYLNRLRILRLNNARDGVKVKEYSFFGLRRLETLDLTNNLLRTLPEKGVKDSLSNMSLKNLYLGGTNYWQCDCRLRWLKVWEIEHDRQTSTINYEKIEKTRDGETFLPAKCHGPMSVKNRYLFGTSTQATDFRCKPEVKTKSPNITSCQGSDVSASCDKNSQPQGNGGSRILFLGGQVHACIFVFLALVDLSNLHYIP